MPITNSDRIAAEAWMAKANRRQATAISARYDRRVARVVISLDNGLEIAFPPRVAEGLDHATPPE